MGITTGASHICFGVGSLDKPSDIFANMNRKNILNLTTNEIAKEKNEFLINPQSGQEMVYSHASNGIGVELLSHDNVSKEMDLSPYLPVFSLNNTDGLSGSEYSDLLNMESFDYFLPQINLKAVAILDPNVSEAVLGQLILLTPNIEDTVNFLTDGIGGIRINSSSIQFRSVSGRQLKIHLSLAENPSKPYLDQVGWNCLSFDVKNLRESLSHLKNYGATQIGQPFSFAVGPREYLIAFVRGPGGELYEFLETVRVVR